MTLGQVIDFWEYAQMAVRQTPHTNAFRHEFRARTELLGGQIVKAFGLNRKDMGPLPCGQEIPEELLLQFKEFKAWAEENGLQVPQEAKVSQN